MVAPVLGKRRVAHRSGIASNDAKRTSEIDVHVGRRLRLRRTIMAMKQDELAEAVGVTYQQIQKYERGDTRLTIGRLFDIGLVLGVPIEWFLDGLRDGAPVHGCVADVLDDRETAELVRVFSRVDNPKVRRQFIDLARVLASVGDEAS
ncbi:MAG: helix-turn-helix domain-containing protein [Hyphomicrobiaceae bacterium]|uniref:helix-turn-helix domain-containing protein n=1 Tax=Pseudorhodoplanes sp. TaxID=1934341 RepID=UPI003D0BF9C8